MMTQPNVLELARQGSPQAIATLMNRSLSFRGITTKVSIKNDCLRVLLESKQSPDKQTLVKFVQQEMTKLKVESIKTVKIYGKQIEKDYPTWSYDFDLTSPTQPDGRQNNIDTPHVKVKDRAEPKTLEAIEPKLKLPNSKDSTSKSKSRFKQALKAVASSEVWGVVLLILIYLRLSFDALFIFYSLTWVTSFYLLTLLATVDTTGFLAQLSYSLFKVIDSLRLPLEVSAGWIYLFALVIMSIWLHRLHAKIKVLFSHYPITPWGAVARYLIPFYSLWGIWNIFATLANRLKVQTDIVAHCGAALRRWLPWFYISLITSNLVHVIYLYQARQIYRSPILPWLFLMKYVMHLFVSIVLLQIVSLIRRALIAKNKQNAKSLGYAEG